jgi:hypothetical protein
MLFTLKTTQKAGGLQILRCQGIAVVNYSFTLDVLTLKPSGFCNVGVNLADKPFYSGLVASMSAEAT